MIISASRRTDIPAFYSEWFYNRIKEGKVYVRNPMNYHRVSSVVLTPDVVDCIVFWTKNPKNMLGGLEALNDYHYYFQFTINPYDHLLEAGVPRKIKVVDTFKTLADKLGGHRVIWRYDPVLLTEKIDATYHIHAFELLAQRLSGYTKKCMIGFLDMYKKTRRNMSGTSARILLEEEIWTLAKAFVAIGKVYGIEVQTCSEEIDFSSLGIKRGKCIDGELVQELTGYPILSRKDRNQRSECLCIESIDIGEYDTCPHECLYCYANHSKGNVLRKVKEHNPDSPLLIGDIMEGDIIVERKVQSFRINGLFDR